MAKTADKRSSRRPGPHVGCYLGPEVLADYRAIKKRLESERPESRITGSDVIRYALNRARLTLSPDVLNSAATLKSVLG